MPKENIKTFLHILTGHSLDLQYRSSFSSIACFSTHNIYMYIYTFCLGSDNGYFPLQTNRTQNKTTIRIANTAPSLSRSITNKAVPIKAICLDIGVYTLATTEFHYVTWTAWTLCPSSCTDRRILVELRARRRHYIAFPCHNLNLRDVGSILWYKFEYYFRQDLLRMSGYLWQRNLCSCAHARFKKR